MFDAMTRGEIPSAEELDAMRVSLNPGENVARRRTGWDSSRTR